MSKLKILPSILDVPDVLDAFLGQEITGNDWSADSIDDRNMDDPNFAASDSHVYPRGNIC